MMGPDDLCPLLKKSCRKNTWHNSLAYFKAHGIPICSSVSQVHICLASRAKLGLDATSWALGSSSSEGYSGWKLLFAPDTQLSLPSGCRLRVNSAEQWHLVAEHFEIVLYEYVKRHMYFFWKMQCLSFISIFIFPNYSSVVYIWLKKSMIPC